MKLSTKDDFIVPATSPFPANQSQTQQYIAIENRLSVLEIPMINKCYPRLFPAMLSY